MESCFQTTIRVVKGNGSIVWSVAISSNAEYAVSGSDNCSAKIWSLASRDKTQVFKQDGRASSVNLSNEGK